MGWNPFDRRSKDQRAIDDAMAGLGKPVWRGAHGHFVRDALTAWRLAATTTLHDPPTATRLDRVRKVVDREPSSRGQADVAELENLRKTVTGSVVYAVAALATVIEGLTAWTADDVAHRIVRIDLSAEVASVARSAGLLEAALHRLGDSPSGHLAKDAEVQAIYARRTEALADRQRTLILQLTALRSYLDGLLDIEKELEKMRWIEHHGSPDFAELEERESDELASLNLSAARDLFDEATDRIGVQLREAAEKLGGSGPR
ncbi:hypothetical protein [Rhodococcus sp. AW25M09]|uniref:hypothetical protein n=1 Tax=Rhodococcus sp. AW25M09 TaxID=1268303 RepID=UPI00034A2757|nr:hypothetical protein [Rhodococcus sp. AW25M09]